MNDVAIRQEAIPYFENLVDQCKSYRTLDRNGSVFGSLSAILQQTIFFSPRPFSPAE